MALSLKGTETSSKSQPSEDKSGSIMNGHPDIQDKETDVGKAKGIINGWKDGADASGETEDRSNEEKKEGQKKGKERKKKRAGKEVEIPDDGVPYDTGWAWMIVLGGFLNFVIVSGYNKACYIFFVRFLKEFKAPVTETSLLFGVKAGVNSIVGLFVMNAAVGRFGVRKTVLTGATCLALSAILGSFATDITSLILTQSVFHGLGMSMLNMPATVLMGYYFRRRRSLANSIAKCGVGVGSVAFPPVVTYFLGEYGLRGSLLLMGGVCLNAVWAASLYRPVSFYKKRKLLRSKDGAESPEHREDDEVEEATERTQFIVTDETHNHDRKTQNNTDTTNLTPFTDNSNAIQSQIPVQLPLQNQHSNAKQNNIATVKQDRSSPDRHENEISNGQTTHDREQQKEKLLLPLDRNVRLVTRSTPELFLSTKQHAARRRTFSESEPVSKESSSSKNPRSVLDTLNESSIARYLSRPDLENDDTVPILDQTSDKSSETEAAEKDSSTCGSRAWRAVKRAVCVLDFSLFRSPMFRLMTVFFLTSPPSHSVPIYLPAMAVERGLTENQTAILLSIIGGLDFGSRLLCGFIADLKILKVSTIIGISLVISGAVCQLTRLLTSFPLLIGLSAIYGLLGGVSAVLMPILIMEDIGLENTSKAMGFNKLFSGAAMAAFHPLIGYIRDSTGSYDIAYNVIGVFSLAAALSVFCLRFVSHPSLHKEEATVPEEEVAPLNNGSKVQS